MPAELKSVWLVIRYYDAPERVFSSEEKAELWRTSRGNKHDFYVEEFVIDQADPDDFHS